MSLLQIIVETKQVPQQQFERTVASAHRTKSLATAANTHQGSRLVRWINAFQGSSKFWCILLCSAIAKSTSMSNRYALQNCTEKYSMHNVPCPSRKQMHQPEWTLVNNTLSGSLASTKPHQIFTVFKNGPSPWEIKLLLHWISHLRRCCERKSPPPTAHHVDPLWPAPWFTRRSLWNKQVTRNRQVGRIRQQSDLAKCRTNQAYLWASESTCHDICAGRHHQRTNFGPAEAVWDRSQKGSVKPWLMTTPTDSKIWWHKRIHPQWARFRPDRQQVLHRIKGHSCGLVGEPMANSLEKECCSTLDKLTKSGTHQKSQQNWSQRRW